jgi:hypothetical protein
VDAIPGRTVDILRRKEVIGRTWDDFMHGLQTVRVHIDNQKADERLALCDNDKEVRGSCTG